MPLFTRDRNGIVQSAADQIVWAGDTNLYRGGVGQLRTDGTFTAAGRVTIQNAIPAGSAIQVNISGEASPRFYVLGTGALGWGSGTAAVDTVLARTGVAALRVVGAFAIDTTLVVTGTTTLAGSLVANGIMTIVGQITSSDQFRSTRTAVGLPILTGTVTGDTSSRYYITSEGKQFWGSGAATQDTTLYRYSPNWLRTDGAWTVGGNTYCLGSLSFGAASDVSLSRTTANTLTLNGLFRVARVNTTDGVLATTSSGDAQFRYTVDAAGRTGWGTGAAVADTFLSRAGVGVLATDGVFRPGRFTTSLRPSAVAAGAGGEIYDTTISKPVWSDGTVWRDAMGTAV